MPSRGKRAGGDEDHAGDAPATEVVAPEESMPGSSRGFELVVVEGPQQSARYGAGGERCSIGSHGSNDFILEDPTVSRFHCEILAGPRGARVRDLGSSNGTVLDGVVVRDADLRDGSYLVLGRSTLRFQLLGSHNSLPLSERTAFGSLLGVSAAMRATFSLLERAAATDSTVLLEGETGTGKEGAAASIHEQSARRDKPFLIVDCGAIPANLLESELFGHERGAFTGAAARRMGAFEEAAGGTIFLDEIGELPLELQPKLLRVLEQRQIRRLGTNRHDAIDVRIVAATNRDLRAEVNDDRFRADLYFRLAVLRVPLPPLRERPVDIPLLAQHLLQAMGASIERVPALHEPSFLESLKRSSWPGNVRELRNYLERCLLFERPVPLAESQVGEAPASPHARDRAAGLLEVDVSVPYSAARARHLLAFEVAYARKILEKHGGNMTRAAAEAGINRGHLWRLANRNRGKE